MAGLFEVIAAEDPRFVDSAENYAKQAQASAERAESAASQASASTAQANSAALVSQQVKTDVENIRTQVINSETNVNNTYNDIVVIQQDVTTKAQQVSTDATQVSNDKVIVTQLKADTQTIYNNTVTEKNAAVAACTGAETARDTSVAKATEANNSAFLSRDWAIKTTGPVDGSDYSAKYWALQAATSVTGVSSFKGRQGAVVPASGDYTAAMVGALPSSGGTVQALKIAASVGNSKVELGTNGTVRLEKVGNDAVVVTDEPAGTPILKGQVNPKVNVNNVVGTLYSTLNKPTANDIGAVPTSQLVPLSGSINWTDMLGKVPVINSAGVTELGRYLDMREQNANVDFNWRWDAGVAGANKLSVLNSGGGAVFEFNSTGRFNVPTNGGDINNRLKVYHDINPMYEWHVPGKYAAASYLTASNDWRFVQSDGNGGETAYRFVSFSDGRFSSSGAVLTDHNIGSRWNQFNTASFRVNNVGTMAAGAYNKLISHQFYSAGSFNMENSLGTFADGDGWEMLCHTLVSTNGADISRIWKFRNSGDFYGPTGNAFGSDGNIWGSVFGGSSVTYWAINRFAPISDIRYKKNITECDGQALDVIDKFRFYSYDWDESKKIVAGKHHVRFGVSAQEMELIDKAYVKETEVHEVMGEDPTTIKTLDDSNLLTLALKAIQELKARVEFLESKVV